MIQKQFFYSWLAAFAVAMPFSSCSEEEGSLASPGRDVRLTVTVNRDANDTRSVLSEENGNLVCSWEASDNILVTDASGNKLGVLTLTSQPGLSSGTFSGKITTTASGNTPLNFLYLGSKTEQELLALSSPLTIDYSGQGGTLDWLSSNDFFSVTENVDIAGSVANIDGIELKRKIAFAHFSIALPSGVSYGGEDITISGPGIYTHASVTSANSVTFSNRENAEEGAITISKTSGNPDFYVAILPKEDKAITPTFTVNIGSKDYTATLKERTWEASEFVRAEDGKAFTITLEAAPEPVDDTVGPVFSVNGKKFKFTKANLAWDRINRLWYLHDEQYTCLYSKGWYDKDGKILKLQNTTGNSADKIDLYNFGATGEFLSYYWSEYNNGQGLMIDQQINVPEYWAYQGGNRTINSRTDGGKNPTQDQTCNTAGTDNFLQNGIQNTPMDWGYSYGKQVNDGHYFTLYSSEWKSVLDNHFVCGATITDVINPVTKKAITGLMIFEANDATTVRNLLDGIATLGSAAFKDITGSGFSYEGIKITAENFKTVEASGKMVFLPMAGLGNTQTINSVGKTDGAYWTADAGSSDYITALIFRFTANSTFNAALTINRMAGCSVRLVKEIK